MGLSILNNIPSLEAQNQLAMTNTNLQNTLFQLSSGSKINSGADDPAGLSIADGLQANISALTQSAQNVTDGVGMLQTADGALSQVTTLLNRAVTLATEAANTGLTQGPGSQQAALQNEFASITAEIDQIGSNTTYNNTAVFSGSQMSVFLSDGSGADAKDPNIKVSMPTLSSSSLGLASYATGTLDLTSNPTAGNTVTIGTQTYSFVSGSPTGANQVQIGTNNGNPDVQQTLQNLQAAVNGAAGAGSLYGSGTAVNQQATITSVNGGSAVVQALQAGTAGNSVNLSTSITSNVGSGGGTTLSGGVDATYDTGTLTLLNNPSLATTATGSITMSENPDTLTSATGNFTITTNTGLAGQTVTVGSQIYTFMANGATSTANNQVAVGTNASDVQDTLTNLADAINGTITSSNVGMANWSSGTDTAAGVASAYYAGSGDQLTVTNNTPGTIGNSTGGSKVSFAASAGTVTPGNYLNGGLDADTVTVGTSTYTFVAAGQAAAANEVALAGAGGGFTAAQNTLQNLMNAINDTGTASATTYGTAGSSPYTANAYAQATTISGNTLNLQALDGSGHVLAGPGTGAYGNNAVLSLSAPDGAITVSGSGTLTGGAASDSVTIGNQAYTFVAAGTAQSGNGNEVALGATPQGTLDNLKAAVNAATTGGGPNGSYYVTTVQSVAQGAQIVSDSNGVATIQSLTSGASVAATNDMGLSVNFQNGNTTGTVGGLTQSTMSGGATGIKATGMVEFTGNPANGDTLTIGATTYTFVTGSASGGTSTAANVEIANTLQGTLTNLEDAVNNLGTPGATTYTAGGAQNTTESISSINNGQVVVTARATGTTANSDALTATSLNKSFTAGSAGGGAAANQANGYLALSMNPVNGNTVTVGNVTYTFTSTTPTSGNQVAIGQTINGSLTNLQEAISYQNSGSTGYGSAYATTMATNSAVTATTTPTGNQLVITAAAGTNPGAAGNSVVLSANLSNGAGGGTVGTVNSQLSGGGANVDLSNPSDATTALTTIAAAIASVAAQRGNIGSGINQMNAAVNVMNNTAQNLTSSLSGIQDANIGQVVANMSKYQVLEQTGIAALAQANSQEQAVLKLLG